MKTEIYQLSVIPLREREKELEKYCNNEELPHKL